MHKEYIKQLVHHTDIKKKHEFEELVEELVEDIKHEDHERYISYEYWMHCILYGEHLGKDLAEHWVSKMENKDGTIGEHWTYEQVMQLMHDKGIKCDGSDFYAALNMVYSDYFNNKFDLNTYVELAKDWLDDKDIEDKIVKYYFFVVK